MTDGPLWGKYDLDNQKWDACLYERNAFRPVGVSGLSRPLTFADPFLCVGLVSGFTLLSRLICLFCVFCP